MGKGQGSPRSSWPLLGTRRLGGGTDQAAIAAGAPNVLWELDGLGADVAFSSPRVDLGLWGPRCSHRCFPRGAVRGVAVQAFAFIACTLLQGLPGVPALLAIRPPPP